MLRIIRKVFNIPLHSPYDGKIFFPISLLGLTRPTSSHLLTTRSTNYGMNSSPPAPYSYQRYTRGRPGLSDHVPISACWTTHFSGSPLFQLTVTDLLSQVFFLSAFISRFFSQKKPVNADVYGLSQAPFPWRFAPPPAAGLAPRVGLEPTTTQDKPSALPLIDIQP